MGNKILKVLIVDDEYLIRNLLRRCLDWKELEMEIIAEASNANEALELVDLYEPDLIFTDIYMPIVDGIEFGTKVLEKYPHIKIVVLTGYDDFKYAQRSIKAGIADFLLKPINDDQIRETVLKLKNKIEKEKKENEEYQNLKKQLSELVPNSKGKLSSQLFDNKVDGFINQNQFKKINKQINNIEEYLKNNINNGDLSLSNVASEFYLNPSYLSRIFKKEVGITFMEYLTQLRMEKAIKLLRETDLKSYEIAEAVGIIDSNYFSTCFKKYTGFRVSEFRRNV